jgi:outer membrane receptor protein involved in Fe transport
MQQPDDDARSFSRPLILAFSLLALFAGPAAAQTPGAAAALDSLLTTRISAASKYAQTAAEAPASVTIITADELRAHRYRDLREVLEQVRGFYVSTDRNYEYLGVRGFSRPTDYNSRILLLIDGQTINDETWGQAPFGSEIPINLDAVERIEIIRGPGSALYGTSAMLAVVNVVLKTGTQLDGGRVRVGVGSGNEREAAVAVGRALGASGSIALSGLLSHDEGGDLYFPEFDTPAQNGGVASGLDWERGGSAIARLAWRGLSASGGFRQRTKAIPTAPFGVAFGDPRTRTTDRTAWGSVALQRELRGVVNVTLRGYYNHYDYKGSYPEDAGPAYGDGGGSSAIGTEGIMVWDVTSGNRLTVGAEFRRAGRAEYWERAPDGTLTSDDQPFDIASVYAQDELQLTHMLTLVAGARHDIGLDLPSATAPRAALILAPDPQTTIKLLYGEAFRSPSAAEATITTSFYQRNPSLRPERIRTLELEAQRRVSNPLLVAASLYSFRMFDLIDQVAFDSEGTLRFENVAAVEARGVEVQVDAVPDGPITGRLLYAVQRAEDRGTGSRMSNSPEHIAQAIATATSVGGLRAAVTTRYESGRGTLVGTSTEPFTRTDLTLAYAPMLDRRWWRSGGEIALRATNLFGERYAAPAGFEHAQAAIAQPGRQLSLRVDWRF